MSRYSCALCDREISVKDNLSNGLITVSVNGRGKPAHRHCPIASVIPADVLRNLHYLKD